MRLSDATVRALVPTDRQVFYRDSTIPGFGVRVTPRGIRTFALMHGTDRRLTTIGRYPIITLAEAKEAARRLLAQKTLGTYQPRSIRFSDALDLFVETHCKGIKTGYEYERMLRREFLPSLQSKTLDKITPHDIIEILDRLSPSIAYHGFNYLKAFFNWSLQRSYLDHSPLVRMKRPKKSPARARVLSDEETKSIWRATEQTTALPALPASFCTIVQLLILTGQRRGEIATLKSDNIFGHTIHLPTTKNGRSHTFPIGALSQTLLAPLSTQASYLFPTPRNQHKPFLQFGAAKLLLDKVSGVTSWTLHDLRRTFATIHARIGTPVHITERLLNHVSGTYSGIVSVYQRHTHFPEMTVAMCNYEKEITRILGLNVAI